MEVLLFYADWCKQCRPYLNILESAIRKEARRSAVTSPTFHYIDVDAHQKLCEYYKICGVPAALFRVRSSAHPAAVFEVPRSRLVGVIPTDDLNTLLPQAFEQVSRSAYERQ